MTSENRRRRIPRIVIVTASVLVSAVVAGWLLTARDTATSVQMSDDGKIIEEFAPGERTSMEHFEATLLQGGSFDSRELLGQVSVYNVWGSWCGPCRIEAPDLARVARETKQDVTFVGINVRDNPSAALAFEKTFEVPYDSVSSADSADALLAFQGALASAGVPSTVVVDREGRIAARAVGPVTYPTLRALVDAVVAQGASSSG